MIERLLITILFSLSNRLSLGANDDHGFGGTAVTGHLQQTIVSIMFSRQLDVEEISVRKSTNRLRHYNYVLGETSHLVASAKSAIGPHHYGIVNSRKTSVSSGFQPITALKLLPFIACTFDVLLG